MSKLLQTTPRLHTIHRRTLHLLSKQPSLHHPSPRFLSPPRSLTLSLYPPLSISISISFLPPTRNFSVQAFDSDSDTQLEPELKLDENGGNGAPMEKITAKDYPSGEFEFKEFGAWKKFVVKCRLVIAFPWERVKKGSVLTMKLRGQITDKLGSRFAQGLSLPQICDNFIKAAYDPRISGVYLHIEPLNCGWGKIEEIRRHILDFRKSGKFVVGYVPACGEKEYYLACACEELYAPPSAYFRLYGLTVQASFLGGIFEKVGIEPQVERIGKYKSAGDQLTRKSISSENKEMLTALLENIYGNWLDKISAAKGKSREDIEKFINEGVYQIQRLKEEGWITNINYDDEVILMLKEKLALLKEKTLPMVDYRRYSGVRKWTLGLSGGKEQIAVIRASGSISRVRSPLNTPMSGVIAEQLIEKIRSVRESKRYKAAIIRIDSPGECGGRSDFWQPKNLLLHQWQMLQLAEDIIWPWEQRLLLQKILR